MMLILIILALVLVHALSIVAAGHALLCKRDPRAAFGWVAVCLFLPLVGVLVYSLFGIDRVDSRAEQLMKKASETMLGGRVKWTSGFLLPEPHGSVPHEQLPPDLRALASPGRFITQRQMLGGNAITPLYNGEQAYPAMLQAIAAAKERVYLSSFIYANDSVGHTFNQALIQAAMRGVDTRLLVDGVGSFHMHIPHKGMWDTLTQNGVQVAHFLPPTLIPPQFSINLRTHRKILACDDKCAFTGGMNISSHHLTNNQHKDRVQDVHFQCTGPIAKQLQVAFLMDWSFVTGNMNSATLDNADSKGNALCRMLMDGPGRSYETILDLFCSMISTARQSIRIMTPYFLPPPELSGALYAAVSRGVHVDIILPAQNNHRLVAWAMHHQLPELVQKGVNLFWQPPPFAHTKLMLVDKTYTLMGSANLDPRSLNLNFELVMEVLDPQLTATLIDFYDNVLARSLPLPANPHLPLALRLRNAASWLFSPYL